MNFWSVSFICASMLVLSSDWLDTHSFTQRVIEKPFHAGPTAPQNGYVDDQICAMCHEDLFSTYQEVGMSKSFYRPENAIYLEDFSRNEYYHEASQRYFKIEKREKSLFFQQYQLDDSGKPINFYERKVDWILGSGNKSRSYLFQTNNGEIYQFPIAWYRELDAWRMSPGFEKRNEVTLGRQVLNECMFCHNAYPDKKDRMYNWHWEPDAFPKDLPEGIGCQRCHGPGGDHALEAMSGTGDVDKIRSLIVNPAKLPSKLRDDVCNQCHLQPAVALIGPRKFEREDFSFQPGEPLSDYMVHVEIEEPDMKKEDRFEINHHAYRLYQSKCYLESQGKLGCITCHDPHKKPDPRQKTDHFRKACLQCHVKHEEKEFPDAWKPDKPDDCIACHMPRHRAQDVVNVTVTDHLIRKTPPEPDWLAERQEKEHILEDIRFYDPSTAPGDTVGACYKSVAILRSYGNADAYGFFRKQLRLSGIRFLTPYFDLISAGTGLNQIEDVLRTTGQILEVDSTNAQALYYRGIVQLKANQIDQGILTLKQSLQSDPNYPNTWYNLGIVYQALGNYPEAKHCFEKALELRDIFQAASLHLAQTLNGMSDTAAAIEAYRQTLSIDPAFSRAYAELGLTLWKNGQPAAAKRTWNHGLKASDDPGQILQVAKQQGVQLKFPD